MARDRNGRFRKCNDLGRNARPKTALTLCEFYLLARKNDYSEDESSKYAIMRVEREQWHSGTLKIQYRKWLTNTRIVATKERFIHLINSPWNGDITLPELERSERSERRLIPLFGKQILKGRNWASNNVIKAFSNFKMICLEDNRRRLGILFKLLCDPKIRKEWLRVKRGRDLFVFGKFNIKEVVDALIGDAEGGGYPVFFSPSSIQAEGYGFPHYHFLEIIEDVTYKAYVGRHIKWWRRYPQRIDELINSSKAILRNNNLWENNNSHMDLWDVIDPNLSPPVLLRRLNRDCSAINESISKPLPPVATEYPWIKEEFEPKKTKEGTLTPLSTFAQLKGTGDALNNCVGYGTDSFARNLQRKERMLVSLVKDDKVRALAEYLPNGDIVQCYGKDNFKVSAQVLKEFKEYNPEWEKEE